MDSKPRTVLETYPLEMKLRFVQLWMNFGKKLKRTSVDLFPFDSQQELKL